MKIKTISPGIYQVNDKVINTNIPIWGKGLAKWEYDSLIDHRWNEVDSEGNYVNYLNVRL